MGEKNRVFTLNTSIRSVNNPEYMACIVDDIGEDFPGERAASLKYGSQTQQKFIASLVSRSPSILKAQAAQ